MFEFLKKRPAKIVRVKFTSAVNARGVDDSVATGREIGTELDIAADDLGVLEGAVTVLGRVSPEGDILPAPVTPAKQTNPDKYEREPVPAGWNELPSCFPAAWDHIQEIRELRFKADQAERELARTSAVRVGDDDLERSTAKLIRARDAVRTFNFETAQRAYIACGDAAISEHRSVEGTRAELERIAFEIFMVRAAPLELTEPQARRVFAGSSLHRKYVFQPEREMDMRSTGNGRTYMDAPITTMASRVFHARERRRTLTALLEEAKAELAATTEALAAPTTPSRKAKPLPAAA